VKEVMKQGERGWEKKEWKVCKEVEYKRGIRVMIGNERGRRDGGGGNEGARTGEKIIKE
jgi:hypothetical protein